MIPAASSLWTSAFGVPASVVGLRLSDAVPGNGHVLMLVDRGARRLHRVPHRVPERSELDRRHARCTTSWWRLAVIGLAAGDAVGPARHRRRHPDGAAVLGWVGMPLKETIATSLACVGIFAIPGTLTHWYLGHIDWAFAIALAIGVIPGAWIGAHFTIASSDRCCATRVGAALGIIATIYAVGELVAWLR